MAANSSFDDILSTTLNNYRRTLEDNIFSARALLFWLKSKDRIQTKSGGAQIVVPLLYATNTTTGSYANDDTIAVTHQSGISAAAYNWKQYAASVNIYGIEEAKNNGQEELIDLVEAKVQQTEESIAESMNTMFFADGTGNGSKDWNGLVTLVDATSTIGGINSTTDAFWQAYVESSSAVLTLGQMVTAYNTTSRGADAPDAIFTTQTLFEKYESLLQPQLRFQDPKVADGGFQNLLFKTAPIMFDTACSSGVMYFLNSKYVKLVVHADKWFTPTPFVKPSNQDLRIAQILSYGNLVVSNRKRLGKLTAKTA